MKVASWNVNGVRAAEKKGELENFLNLVSPDIFLMQEIKSRPENLSAIEKKYSKSFHVFWNSAEKPGYAGTGVLVKKSISVQNFQTQMLDWNDSEGRIAQIDFKNGDENFSILGVYFPNGGKSEAAWDEKIEFYHHFLSHVNSLRESGKTVIWGGDLNVAHQEIDLARPRENRNSIGFLPAERDWVSKCISENWVDVFRQKFPEKVVYSWWHLISRARARNVGWRIDSIFCDQKFYERVKKIEYLNHQMGSDHCPVVLEF